MNSFHERQIGSRMGSIQWSHCRWPGLNDSKSPPILCFGFSFSLRTAKAGLQICR